MEKLKEVVSLDYSTESLAKLRALAEQFVDKEKEELKLKTELLLNKRKRIKELQTEISKQEDTKDRLIIVKLIRKLKLKKQI